MVGPAGPSPAGAQCASAARGKPSDQLRKVLQPLTFDAELAEHNDRFVEGTREWILRDIERWRLDVPPRASHCRALLGPPGMGKTAIVARLCHGQPEAVLAVHLCKHNDSRKRDPRRMVRSLAYQMACKLPEYCAALEAEVDDLRVELDGLSVSALVDRLLLQPLAATSPPASAVGRSLLVIDALDEAEHDRRNMLLEAVARDFGRLPKWLGVLVTSRCGTRTAPSNGQGPATPRCLECHHVPPSPSAAHLHPPPKPSRAAADRALGGRVHAGRSCR